MKIGRYNPDPQYLEAMRNPFSNSNSNSSVTMPPPLRSNVMQQPRLPLGNLQANVAANLSPARASGDKLKGKQSKNTKRPHSAITSEENPSAPTPPSGLNILDNDPRLTNITEDCDRVRYKIYTYLAESGLRVSDFVHQIGTTHRSYNAFMDQSGALAGKQSNVYRLAFAFFKRRELGAVIPAPNKKAKTSSTGSSSTASLAVVDSAPSGSEASTSATGSTTKKPKSKVASSSKDTDKTKNKDADPYAGLSDIQLEGEENDDIPVYSTCDDIRRQISNHLRSKNVTQACFLRALRDHSDTFSPPQYRKTFQSAQLKRFRDLKGATGGSTSGLFYASYILFEKMRIRDRKPKSEKREEMERIWGKDGFDRETKPNQRYLVGAGQRVVCDEFGVLEVQGQWSRPRFEGW